MSKMNSIALAVDSVRVKNRTKLHDLCLTVNSPTFSNKIDSQQSFILNKSLAKAIHVGDMYAYLGTKTPRSILIMELLNDLNFIK
jgi:hypothetical protein